MLVWNDFGVDLLDPPLGPDLCIRDHRDIFLPQSNIWQKKRNILIANIFLSRLTEGIFETVAYLIFSTVEGSCWCLMDGANGMPKAFKILFKWP